MENSTFQSESLNYHGCLRNTILRDVSSNTNLCVYLMYTGNLANRTVIQSSKYTIKHKAVVINLGQIDGYRDAYISLLFVNGEILECHFRDRYTIYLLSGHI